MLSAATVPTHPCFLCGQLIRPAEFLGVGRVPGVVESPGARYAICARCGAPNGEHDSDFVVFVDARCEWQAGRPLTGVFSAREGGWQASCDCGLDDHAPTQAGGWAWILDHDCRV